MLNNGFAPAPLSRNHIQPVFDNGGCLQQQMPAFGFRVLCAVVLIHLAANFIYEIRLSTYIYHITLHRVMKRAGDAHIIQRLLNGFRFEYS